MQNYNATYNIVLKNSWWKNKAKLVSMCVSMWNVNGMVWYETVFYHTQHGYKGLENAVIKFSHAPYFVTAMKRKTFNDKLVNEKKAHFTCAIENNETKHWIFNRKSCVRTLSFVARNSIVQWRRLVSQVETTGCFVWATKL